MRLIEKSDSIRSTLSLTSSSPSPRGGTPKIHSYQAVIRFEGREDRVTFLAKRMPHLRAVVHRVCETMEWVFDGASLENPVSSQGVDVLAVEATIPGNLPQSPDALIAELRAKLSPVELRSLLDNARIEVFRELKLLSRVERDRAILRANIPSPTRTTSPDSLPTNEKAPPLEQEANPTTLSSEASPVSKYPALRKLLQEHGHRLREPNPVERKSSTEDERKLGTKKRALRTPKSPVMQAIRSSLRRRPKGLLHKPKSFGSSAPSIYV